MFSVAVLAAAQHTYGGVVSVVYLLEMTSVGQMWE